MSDRLERNDVTADGYRTHQVRRGEYLCESSTKGRTVLGLIKRTPPPRNAGADRRATRCFPGRSIFALAVPVAYTCGRPRAANVGRGVSSWTSSSQSGLSLAGGSRLDTNPSPG